MYGRNRETGTMKQSNGSARRRVNPTGLPKKTYWHLYSLQTLESDKLARIVNKILNREYVLIK